jgi:hypothetical protein
METQKSAFSFRVFALMSGNGLGPIAGSGCWLVERLKQDVLR